MTQPSTPPRFHTIKVEQIRPETTDAVSLRFAIPKDLEPAYTFNAGQYLTLRATIDGEDMRRSYSICSAPHENELRIAVKRVDDGKFSTWVNTHLRPGDTIEVMTPTGRFGLTTPKDHRLHIAFAAGSGITPILSIIRTVMAREPNSRFILYYGSRTVADILFRETLEDLKDQHLNRLSVFHVLSREQQDLPILNGHLDAEKAPKLLRAMAPIADIDEAYLCGPEAMIETLSTTLETLGLNPTHIHAERFVSAHGGAPRPPQPIETTAPPAHRATIIADGKRRDIPIAKNEAILDAALRAGLDLPFACKGGMCSTCRARLTEGTATMELNYSLEPWELEQGFILTCQARPTTAQVTVDYDQM